RQPLRLLHRVRLAGASVLAVLALVFLAEEGAPLWVLVLVLLVGLSTLWLFRAQQLANETRTLTHDMIRWLIVGVILLQTCAITLTGGLRSPFLIAYVPSLTLAGMLLGRARTIAAPFVLGVGFVILFLVLRLAGLAAVFPQISDALGDWMLAVIIPSAMLLSAVAGA